MMITTKGYLISKQDYDLFDEIIVFLNEYGLKFTCFSSGSRKIKSKNGRSLFFGNFLEFSIFYSENKISRLKKVTTLSTLDDDNRNKISLWLINQIYTQLKIEHIKFFHFYQEILYLNLNNHNDYLIMLLICIKLIKWFHLLDFNHIDYQQNPNYLNLDDFTLVNQINSKHIKWKLNLKYTNIFLSIYKLEQIDHIDVSDIKVKVIILIIKRLLLLINNELKLKINLNLI